jgi:DNA-binding NtrC family response regulator
VWETIPLAMTDCADDLPLRRVLIVEDDSQMLHILAATMEDAGYEVGTAKNGVEGLIKFKEGSWDVVITDRAMPTMSGEEMAASIKACSPDTSVVLISGLVHNVRDSRHFVAIIQKPFRRTHLLSVVEGAIAARQRLHQTIAPRSGAERRNAVV